MGAHRWVKRSFHATVGVAWLAAAGVALHGGIAEANAQEAVGGRIQGNATGIPVLDERPQDVPELPSHYQGDTALTKQRSVDRREVDQEQDRYYQEQADNAQRRTERMEREAGEYYGRK